MIRVGALLTLLFACGSGQLPAGQALDQYFESDAARAARQAAPDLYRASVQVRDQARAAERAGDHAAAADHATRARLILDTAITEHQRLQLEARRLRLEEETRQAEQQAQMDREVRERIEREMGRQAAAVLAREESSRALERSEARGRRRRPDREVLVQAIQIRVRRVLLSLAAIRAMGADPSTVERIEQRLEDLPRDPQGALERVEEAQAVASTTLASLRAGRNGVTADERTSLLEGLREARVEFQQSDVGIVITMTVFRPRSERLTPSGIQRLGRLGRVLRAHPHGPVQVSGTSTGRVSRNRRVSRAREILIEEGVESTRVQIHIESEVGSDTVVKIVLPAYGPVPIPVAPQPT